MTSEKVQIAWKKYVRMIPLEKHHDLYHALNEADDQYFEVLMLLPVKKPVIALLFSIFLGHLGVDRFYVGPIGLGIGKLALTIAGVMLPGFLQFPELRYILGLASIVWWIIDIFLIRKMVKQHNFEVLWMFLRAHRSTSHQDVES